MSGNRLTIFDTTLRDGEQAPGFSLEIDEKLALARQLRSLGVDIIEAGFPIASEADAEAVRTVADASPRAGHCRPGALPRQGHRARRVGAAPARRAAGSTSSSPRRTCTSSGSCECRARSACGRPWPRSGWRATTPTTCSSRRKTRRAAIRDFLCQIIEAVIQAGAKTINLPDTVGYSTPDEVGDVLPLRDRARAELRPGHLQRALPRRSRPRGRQHAGGDRRRRAAGRVHDQRHRRARRQRVARRDRDGDPRPRRSPALRDTTSTRRRSTPRASC